MFHAICYIGVCRTLHICTDLYIHLKQFISKVIKCDVYLGTIPEAEKHKSELGEKTGFMVEFVKIEVTIESCGKWYREYRKTSPGS